MSQQNNRIKTRVGKNKQEVNKYLQVKKAEKQLVKSMNKSKLKRIHERSRVTQCCQCTWHTDTTECVRQEAWARRRLTVHGSVRVGLVVRRRLPQVAVLAAQLGPERNGAVRRQERPPDADVLVYERPSWCGRQQGRRSAAPPAGPPWTCIWEERSVSRLQYIIK